MRWPHRNGPALLLAGGAAILGGAIRAWFVLGPMGEADLDQATVAWQTQQFARGRLAVFFPNQPYGGTLETMVTALLTRLGFGLDAALWITPTLCFAGAAVVCAVSARRLGPGPWPPVVAGSLVWVFPIGLVWTSTKAFGFWGISMFLAAVTIEAALRVRDDPERLLGWVVIGIVAGASCWTTPLLVPASLMAGLWLLVRIRPRVVQPAVALLAALVASGPWWWWNWHNDWASFEGGRFGGTRYLDSLGAWLRSLGMLVGTSVPGDAERALLPDWLPALIVAGILVIAAARSTGFLSEGRRAHREVVGLCITIVLGSALLDPINPAMWLSESVPRYLIPVAPAFLLLLTAAVVGRPEAGDARTGPARRRAATARSTAAVAGTMLLATALVLDLWGASEMSEMAHQPVPSRFIAPRPLDEVVAHLRRAGRDRVVTDALGMQLWLASDGDITGASLAVPRVPEFERSGVEAEPTTVVLPAEDGLNTRILLAWAAARDEPISVTDIGGYRILEFDRRVDLRRLGLTGYLGAPLDPDDIGG